MKKAIKKIAAALMAVSTLAVSMIGTSANATSKSQYGDPGYGSWYYSLNVDNHLSSGMIGNRGTVARYNTIKLALVHRNAIQYTVVQGTEKTSSDVTSPNEYAGIGKAFGNHNVLYAHGYTGMIYGSSNPDYSPVVETVQIIVNC